MAYGNEINHWCVLCGAGYHACDACSRERNLTPWKALTDTVEHYKIFMVLKNYHNKKIDRKKAKELLSHTDLSDQENFKENTKRLLSEIYSEAI